MRRITRIRKSIKHSSWFSETMKMKRTPLDYLITSRGLVNRCNDCYINSCIQCLVHCEPFAQVMLHGEHDPFSNSFCSLCAMKSITREILQEKKDAGSALQISENSDAINPEFINGTQQDTHEFFSSLISKMTMEDAFGCATSRNHAIESNSLNNSLVRRVFEFTTKTTVICSECGVKTETEESCNDLCLQIMKENKEEITTLNEGLQYYFNTEELEGENAYMCSGCNERVKATKTVSLQKGPNVLVICLTRFLVEYDMTTRAMVPKKLDHHVKFTRKLDVTPYMHGMTPEEELKLGEYQYRLSAFTDHVGSSTKAGHYVSNVFLPAGSDPESGKIWLTKNDENVTKTEFKKDSKAYLLFYTREDWQPTDLAGPKRKKESERKREVDEDKKKAPGIEASDSQMREIVRKHKLISWPLLTAVKHEEKKEILTKTQEEDESEEQETEKSAKTQKRSIGMERVGRSEKGPTRLSMPSLLTVRDKKKSEGTKKDLDSKIETKRITESQTRTVSVRKVGAKPTMLRSRRSLTLTEDEHKEETEGKKTEGKMETTKIRESQTRRPTVKKVGTKPKMVKPKRTLLRLDDEPKLETEGKKPKGRKETVKVRASQTRRPTVKKVGTKPTMVKPKRTLLQLEDEPKLETGIKHPRGKKEEKKIIDSHVQETQSRKMRTEQPKLRSMPLLALVQDTTKAKLLENEVVSRKEVFGSPGGVPVDHTKRKTRQGSVTKRSSAAGRKTSREDKTVNTRKREPRNQSSSMPRRRSSGERKKGTTKKSSDKRGSRPARSRRSQRNQKEEREEREDEPEKWKVVMEDGETIEFEMEEF